MNEMPRKNVPIWVMCNGAAGAEKQASVLGEAVCAELEKIGQGAFLVRVPVSLKKLPRVGLTAGGQLKMVEVAGITSVYRSGTLAVVEEALNQFGEPQVVIGSGRTTTALTAHMGRRFPGALTVSIQHPRCDLSGLNLVVTPKHDEESVEPSAKILFVSGSLHNVRWRPRRPSGGAAVAGILIGGETDRARFAREEVSEMVKAAIAGLLDEQNPLSAVIVSTSRRSPRWVLDDVLRVIGGRNVDGLGVWDGCLGRWAVDGARGARADVPTGNPYSWLMNHGELFLVTADSVSMTSEAEGTGQKVGIIGLSGTKGRIAQFHALRHSRQADAANFHGRQLSGTPDDVSPSTHLYGRGDGTSSMETDAEMVARYVVNMVSTSN